MTEIKIRYTFKRKEDGHLWQSIWSLDSIEKGSEGFGDMLNNTLWQIIGKDLYSGVTCDGNEIYENDIVEFEPYDDWSCVYKHSESRAVSFEDGIFYPVPDDNNRNFKIVNSIYYE